MHRCFRSAWAPPPLPHRTPAPLRRAARCCAQAPTSQAPAVPLDATAVALAVSAALVLHAPRAAGAAALSPAALAAYRDAKGAPDAAGYAVALRAAREPWHGAAAAAAVGGGRSARAALAARQRLLHRVCNGEGDATYEDPETGYTVFAAVAHLRRGGCCGVPEGGGVEERTHRCRHCPYAPDGRLRSPAYRRLKERIPLLDAVRKETAAVYGASARAVAAVGGEAVESAEEEGESGCADCKRSARVTCTRCKGYKFLISPESMLCPQCEATGEHPCMTCTPWTPPQRTEFGS